MNVRQPPTDPNDEAAREANSSSALVGDRLRMLRKKQKLSIRALAKLSGLSVNTLSLIENRKTSPSVSTLEQLAESLDVPIASFFEVDRNNLEVVYQRAEQRQQIMFARGQMEKLSTGMPHAGSEPFIARLEPDANSGSTPAAFPGREFVYCLEGQISFTVGNESYLLTPGDSLIFNTKIPHSWRNTASSISRALLVLCPMLAFDDLPEKYFLPENNASEYEEI